LSVADNAGDAVFLHISASSERQEWGNKTRLKKRTKHEILKHHDVYASFFVVVLFHRLSGYTLTVTSYFTSEYHIKTKHKTSYSNYSLPSPQQNAYFGKMKSYV
jgi:hypothetical protein